MNRGSQTRRCPTCKMPVSKKETTCSACQATIEKNDRGTTSNLSRKITHNPCSTGGIMTTNRPILIPASDSAEGQDRWCAICSEWFEPRERQLCTDCKKEPVAVCSLCGKQQIHRGCPNRPTTSTPPTITITSWECPNCHQRIPDVGAETCGDCGTVIPICILCGKPHPHETCATDQNLVFVR